MQQAVIPPLTIDIVRVAQPVSLAYRQLISRLADSGSTQEQLLAEMGGSSSEALINGNFLRLKNLFYLENSGLDQATINRRCREIIEAYNEETVRLIFKG